MNFECDKKEYEVLERLVEKDVNLNFVYCLALTLLGLKPGLTPPNNFNSNDFEEYRDVLESIGLSSEKINIGFMNVSEIPCSVEERTLNFFVIAKKTDRFDMLKEDYKNKFVYYRDLGLFLGYPEEDVEWYVEESRNGNQNHYQISKEALGHPEDFNKVVSLALYVPKPTKKRYRVADKKSERYKNNLRRADEVFDTDIAKLLIQNQLD